MSVNLINSSDITVSQTNNDIELNVNDSVVEAFTGDLTNLTTTDKSNLVSAINEANTAIKVVASSFDSSNGYIKFDNGVMLQWKLQRVTVPALTSWGNIYFADYNIGNWVVPFTDFFCFGSQVNNQLYWTTVNGMTQTSAGTVRYFRATTSGATNVYTTVWAIGKWN